MARAELFDRAAFAHLIGATNPENWPPELATDALPWFLERLENDAGNFGWLTWNALLSGPTANDRVLLGGIGFKGKPAPDGTVEVGYSVLPQFQRQGYAGEMLDGILDWAFTHPEVVRVVADTMPSNTASVCLLGRRSFRQVGPGTDEGSVMFERLRLKAEPCTSATRERPS